jgi:hypothetical protein
MKNKLIDLIFVNWKTTTVGLGLMLVAFTLVAMDKASLAEVGGFFAIALPLLFIKDPKDGKG